jgi:hypothetical protein
MSKKKCNASEGVGDVETIDSVDRRLLEEINILKLEGSIFCFDPREAKRRTGKLEFDDIRKGAPDKKVQLLIDPAYGQPSVLAYKVLQAIFYKIGEEGVTFTEDGRALYADRVAFTQRELARLAGRKGWGRATSIQLNDAVMQLQRTSVIASFFDKQSGRWGYGTMVIVPDALFSCRGDSISECLITLSPRIVDSLNRRHIATFNLIRLNGLSPIGLALYKQVFYNFSLLHDGKRAPSTIRFKKDYEAICNEWLGRLKVLKHRAHIVKDQLGRHFDDLQVRRLVRKWEIEKNKEGTGFNITFWPGEAFFHDYELYYRERQRPRLKHLPSPELQAVQKPLELVARFHQALGHKRTIFQDSETGYARELAERHSEHDVHDLIDYGLRKAADKGIKLAVFGGLKMFYEDWCTDHARRAQREGEKARISACPYCLESGMLELREQHSHHHFVHACPHEPQAVEELVAKLGAERL